MISKYTTLELINDLKTELQRFPEELALLFPERVEKFKHRHLSIFWKKSQGYISKVISKIENNKQYFRFLDDEDGLKKLEKINFKEFGLKRRKCISLIENYRNNNITILEFINLIEKELGRISGYIIVNDYELGLILKGHKKYFERLKARINNPNDTDYNPNFKFSRERLREFEENLKILLGEEKSIKIIDYLNKFEQLNSDLKDYSGQQYTLKNPDIFTNFDILDTFYWLGFLYADAYINQKNYRINFELSSKDRERVETFAEFIGLDPKYIHDRTRILFHNGVPQLYNLSYVQPVCKPMVFDLCNLGYCKKKAKRKDLPKFIRDLINEAKIKDWKNWHFTLEGKKAITWLFGFYDGDGSYGGFHTARLRSASRTLLEQVKYYFDIPNRIGTAIEPDTEVFIFEHIVLLNGYYTLNLGSILFSSMLRNYKKSMKRKRPLDE